jgi:hypothetical protein
LADSATATRIVFHPATAPRQGQPGGDPELADQLIDKIEALVRQAMQLGSGLSGRYVASCHDRRQKRRW